MEGLEQFRQVCVRDAYALVFNGDFHAIALLDGMNCHGRGRRRVFECVGHQVAQDVVQQFGVEPGLGIGWGGFYFEAFTFGSAAGYQFVGDLCQCLGQMNRLRLTFEHLRVGLVDEQDAVQHGSCGERRRVCP